MYAPATDHDTLPFRSGSMGANDRRPLPGTPVTQRIASRANDRLGAVYSALYTFWAQRHGATNTGPANAAANRRDAYSVILFDHEVSLAVENDFQSTPDLLLNACLAYSARGGTDYTSALVTAQAIMERRWSTERSGWISSPRPEFFINSKNRTGHP